MHSLVPELNLVWRWKVSAWKIWSSPGYKVDSTTGCARREELEGEPAVTGLDAPPHFVGQPTPEVRVHDRARAPGAFLGALAADTRPTWVAFTCLPAALIPLDHHDSWLYQIIHHNTNTTQTNLRLINTDSFHSWSQSSIISFLLACIQDNVCILVVSEYLLTNEYVNKKIIEYDRIFMNMCARVLQSLRC